MTPIINSRVDLEALQGTDVYADALRAILGTTTTWVNDAANGGSPQWRLVSVNDTLQYLGLTLDELIAECASAGIIPTTPSMPIDHRFYNTQKNGEIYTSVPKELHELKAAWTIQIKRDAYTKLAPSDWMIVRHSEIGTDIPDAWTAYREAIRAKTAETVTALEAAADIDAFIAVVTGVEWPVSPDVPQIVEPAPAA